MATKHPTPEIRVFAFDELPKESSGDTYWRAAAQGDGSTVGINWFAPGHPPWPVHDHPFDQITMVLKGQMVLTVGDVDYLMVAPSIAWIPANAPHAGNVYGDEPCLNIDVFGVVREDFLHLTGYQNRTESVDSQ